MVAGEPLRRVGAPTPRLLRSPPLAKVLHAFPVARIYGRHQNQWSHRRALLLPTGRCGARQPLFYASRRLCFKEGRYGSRSCGTAESTAGSTAGCTRNCSLSSHASLVISARGHTPQASNHSMMRLH